MNATTPGSSCGISGCTLTAGHDGNHEIHIMLTGLAAHAADVSQRAGYLAGLEAAASYFQGAEVSYPSQGQGIHAWIAAEIRKLKEEKP